jgi:hypothetical protein
MEQIKEENVVIDEPEPQTQEEVKKETTIVFCLEGESFSSEFLRSWTELFAYCITNNIKPILSNAYDSNIFHLRNMALMGNPTKGVNQKPFDGKLDYDYILWISSDMIFTVDMFKRLLEHNKQVVSALCMRKDLKSYDMIRQYDQDYLVKNGSFEYVSREQVEEYKKQCGENVSLMDVQYCGMGFMLMKRGVIESMKYPWFFPTSTTLQDPSGNVLFHSYNNDAESFCSVLRQSGVPIYVDTTAMVGLQRNIIV